MLGLIQHYFKCNQSTSRVQNTVLPHLPTPIACVRNHKLPKFSPLSPQSIFAVLQRNGRVRIPHYLESIPITYPIIAKKDKARRKWDKCAEITAYDWASPPTVSESIWDEMVLLVACCFIVSAMHSGAENRCSEDVYMCILNCLFMYVPKGCMGLPKRFQS